jgi:acylglycerol lipase
MEHSTLRRSESHFEGAGGRRLLRRAWLPEHPSLAIVLVHGFAEHSGRYEHVGAWFAARGGAVHAYDHRGHGRSSGPRCHVQRFEDLLDDLEVLLDRVREEHPEIPIFLIGHSMGGLVVSTLACEREPRVDGIVTSGAALALGQGISRGRILAARALRWIAPRLSIDAGLPAEGLSTDPEVVRAYLDDPLVERKTTTALAAEMLTAVRRTARHAGSVRVPMLLLHGEEDPLCPVEGSAAFARGAPDATFRSYPGMRHEIFNEPDHEVVLGDVWSWIQARIATPREAVLS